MPAATITAINRRRSAAAEPASPAVSLNSGAESKRTSASVGGGHHQSPTVTSRSPHGISALWFNHTARASLVHGRGQVLSQQVERCVGRDAEMFSDLLNLFIAQRRSQLICRDR